MCREVQPLKTADGTAAMRFWSSASTFSRFKLPRDSGRSCSCKIVAEVSPFCATAVVVIAHIKPTGCCSHQEVN